MTDLTDTILNGAFAAALLIAATAMAVRCLAAARARGPAASGWQEAADGPFAPPRSAVAPPPLPVGRVQVTWYRATDLWGVAFVFLVFAGLATAGSSGADGPPPKIDPATLVVNIAFQFIMAAVVTLFVIWRVDPVRWLGLRWKAWPWVLVIAPGSVLGMWAVFGGLYQFGYVKWMESLGVETVQDTVRLLQQSDDPLVLGLMAAAAVVAAPLCEEIVFRGYFYPVLKRFAGAWPAAVCSSLVFACAHGNLTAALPLFLFGGLLVLLYEKTGSLWAPIAVHFCFNGATVVIQIAARHFGIPLEGTP